MADYNFVFHQLRHLSRLFRRRPQGSQHLGRSAYQLLSLINREGNISTRELAEKMDIRISSLNEMLQRLEIDALVQRNRSETDRRIFVLSVSDAGKKLLDSADVQERELSGLLAEILSPAETETLSSLLGKLTEGLEQRLPEADRIQSRKEEFIHAEKHGPRRPRISD